MRQFDPVRHFKKAAALATDLANEAARDGDHDMTDMYSNDAIRHETSADFAAAGNHKHAVLTYFRGDTGCRDHAHGHSDEEDAAFLAYLKKHAGSTR